MAKEYFKAEYIKGFPHGDIKITHNMSYEHIKALHTEITGIMKRMEEEQKPQRAATRKKRDCKPRTKSIMRLPSHAAEAAEKLFFGVVGSVEAV